MRTIPIPAETIAIKLQTLRIFTVTSDVFFPFLFSRFLDLFFLFNIVVLVWDRFVLVLMTSVIREAYFVREEVDFIDLKRKLLSVTIFRLLNFINDLHVVFFLFFIDTIKNFVIRVNLNKLFVWVLWLFYKHFLLSLRRFNLATNEVALDIEDIFQIYEILWEILKLETFIFFYWFLNLKVLGQQNLFRGHQVTSD